MLAQRGWDSIETTMDRRLVGFNNWNRTWSCATICGVYWIDTNGHGGIVHDTWTYSICPWALLIFATPPLFCESPRSTAMIIGQEREPTQCDGQVKRFVWLSYVKWSLYRLNMIATATHNVWSIQRAVTTPDNSPANTRHWPNVV